MRCKTSFILDVLLSPANIATAPVLHIRHASSLYNVDRFTSIHPNLPFPRGPGDSGLFVQRSLPLVAITSPLRFHFFELHHGYCFPFLSNLSIAPSPSSFLAMYHCFGSLGAQPSCWILSLSSPLASSMLLFLLISFSQIFPSPQLCGISETELEGVSLSPYSPYTLLILHSHTLTWSSGRPAAQGVEPCYTRRRIYWSIFWNSSVVERALQEPEWL
jgi:hypothetical protein